MDKENKRVGKWIPHWVNSSYFDNENLLYFLVSHGCYCSLCGYWYEYDPWPKFCPKCKAELKEPF